MIDGVYPDAGSYALYRQSSLGRRLDSVKTRTRGLKSKTGKYILQNLSNVATQHLVSAQVCRQIPDESELKYEWWGTKRSPKEKHSGGKDFPLVEHLGRIKRMERRYRQLIKVVEDGARSAIQQEIFKGIPRKKVDPYFDFRAAWCIPFVSTLKIGPMPIPVILHTAIFEENSEREKELPFRFNRKEVLNVKYLRQHEFQRIQAQIMRYVPPNYFPELEMLINNTLSGKWDSFGPYTITPKIPKGKTKQTYVTLPAASLNERSSLHPYTYYMYPKYIKS
jgi:hypothetical protein